MQELGLTAALDVELGVREVTREQHAAFVQSRSETTQSGHTSFLQAPSWADVKRGWRPLFVGWFDADTQVGGALVLCRTIPHSRKFFAYLPEGPVLEWSRRDMSRQLEMLVDLLRSLGAFAVRIGPPLEYRRWSAARVKAGRGRGRHLHDVEPDDVDPVATVVADALCAAGWRRCAVGEGEAQPRFLFTVPLAGRDVDDVWSGLSQSWRRDIRRATKAGVTVAEVGLDGLAEFYRLVRETEERNGFDLGRSLAYFQRQYDVLNQEEPGRMRLYVARHEGAVLAAHTLVVLGQRAWYLTGGSATRGREVRPSHALQWRMIEAACASGVETYDMRGVPISLDPDDAGFGLLRWKLGTGGVVVETLGEWELGLPGLANRALHRTMRRHLAHR
jgi:lipid II:glycine glycyltransferase (peptidoglycan interpeptide bridge formation enzyme)